LNILAIDTSAETLSAGLSTDAGDFCVEADAGMTHSELLFDAVDSVMGLARLDRGAIDVFACMRGPGSFTGLRIGFAAVKGLSLVFGKEMISVPTLDCMAYSFARSEVLCVPVLDARRGRFFTALYRGGRRLTGYLDCAAGELAALITANIEKSGRSGAASVAMLAGRAADPARQALSALLPDITLLDDGLRCLGASLLLQYIKEFGIVENVECARSSAPLYIRKSDAEIKRDGNQT
jgi:tRNA threonylcarbamoyladenosine biosynthesis protein TsaB